MKRHILLAGLVVAAVGGMAWLALRLREPVYRGKALSVWLGQFEDNHWKQPDNDLDQEARAAIRHIGTNEIPTYLKLMTARKSRFRLKLMAVVPKGWQARLHMPDAMAYENELHRLRTLGALGIVALGPDAKAAVPLVIEMLKDKDHGVREDAVFALRSLGPVAREALPSLIKYLEDPGDADRFNALLSLGEIHQEAERVIPILIGYLDSKEQSLRGGALWSLRKFGAEARPAFSSVLKRLIDEDASVRTFATNALIAIDQEAAAKVGVQNP